MIKFYDVTIIGASLGGSAAAFALSKKNISVCLLDKDSFPKTKVCGEGLSRLGADQLKKLGLGHIITSCAPVPYCGYFIRKLDLNASGNRDTCNKPLRFGIDNLALGYGIQRHKLDSELVYCVTKANNIDYFTNAKVLSILPKSDFVEIILKDRTIHSKYVILANGANSSLSKQISSSKENYSVQAERFGASIQMEGEFNNQIQRVNVFLTSVGEICATRVGEHSLNLSFIGERQLLKGFSQNSSNKKVNKNEPLLRICSTIGFSPSYISNLRGGGYILPQIYQSNKERVLLVGDSCEQFDPIGGMGMTHAIASGRIASEEITRVLLDKGISSNLQYNYTRRRETMARKLRGLTRLTQFALNKCAMPIIQSALIQSPITNSLLYGVDLSNKHKGLNQISANLLVGLAGVNII